ncbi:MAG: hypothetical protein AAFX80_20845 [Cyanobacteria bacterium J06639_18]
MLTFLSWDAPSRQLNAGKLNAGKLNAGKLNSGQLNAGNCRLKCLLF